MLQPFDRFLDHYPYVLEGNAQWGLRSEVEQLTMVTCKRYYVFTVSNVGVDIEWNIKPEEVVAFMRGLVEYLSTRGRES